MLYTLEELRELRTELENTAPSGVEEPDNALRAQQQDIEAAINDVEQCDATIWVAHDEDGYYFAIEEV